MSESNQLGLFTPSIKDEDETRPAKNGKRANNLSGKDWTKNSISVWSDIQKSKEEQKLAHPAIFPVMLPKRLLESFTTDEDRLILDPFMGTGATLLAARQMGKAAIGFELSDEFIEVADKRLSQSDMFSQDPNYGAVLNNEIALTLTRLRNPDVKGSGYYIYARDSTQMSSFIREASVDMIITSPPYWDILNQKRTADYKSIRNYGDTEADLGKIEDYKKFLQALGKIFGQCYRALKPGKFCCVVVMDIRKKDKFYPFHSDVASMMQEVGFIYDDLIIWDRRHEYNNMRPLGYPARFRINKAHEFILIFQRPEEK